MKRFYRLVTIVEQPQGHAVLLDGKPLHTPARKPLALPNAALAQAVADEWAVQGGNIEPSRMPLTRLVNHVNDRAGENRVALTDQLCGYNSTDLLRYRAPGPQSLVVRQAAAWDPLLAWAADRLGATLPVTTGIMPLENSSYISEIYRNILNRLDLYSFVGLGEVIVAAGSLVIGLALLEGRIDAAAAWAAASVDDDYQAERWGADGEAAAMLAARRASLEAGARLLALAAPLPMPPANDMSKP